MNDLVDLLAEPDERLSALRDPIFHDVLKVHQAELDLDKDRIGLWRWFGIGGMAVGFLGMACFAGALFYLTPQVRYTEIDDASGLIRESFGAEDAPKHFNERVRWRYLTEYTELRERFVWQMDAETDHRIKLMSSPAEQVRYQEDRTKHNPLTKYGMTGGARVLKFNPFTERGEGKDETFEYDVPFTKEEILTANPGRLTETKMTARIIFQFHPELPMNAQDRLHNEAGLMVLSYSANPDDAP
jgi:hypothetical protein